MSHIDLHTRLRISKILNPLFPRLVLIGDAVVLGYGTLLAKVVARDGLWHAELADETVQAMLKVAYGATESVSRATSALKAAAHHLLVGNRSGAAETLLLFTGGLAWLVNITPSFATDMPVGQKITAMEAIGLVGKMTGRRVSNYYFDDPQPDDDFIDIDIFGVGGGIAVSYSVNIRTGDVFKDTFCWLEGPTRKTSLALRKAQAEIKKRFTAAELPYYDTLRGLVPCYAAPDDD